MKQLPDSLPPLPDFGGSKKVVYVGVGPITRTNGEPHRAKFAYDPSYQEFKWSRADANGHDYGYNTTGINVHYADFENSEIARLNAEPEEIDPKFTHFEKETKRGVIIHTTTGPNKKRPYVGSTLFPDGIWAAQSYKSSDLIEVREPREFWVNVYADNATHIAYDTKSEAHQGASPDRTACILVREVREEGA